MNRSLIRTSLVVLYAAATLHAALTWDASPAQAGAQGQKGIWSKTGTTWWNGSENTTWDGAQAIFPDGTYSVTLEGNLTVKSISAPGSKGEKTSLRTGNHYGTLEITDAIDVPTADRSFEVFADSAGSITGTITKTGAGTLVLSHPSFMYLNSLVIKAGRVNFYQGNLNSSCNLTLYPNTALSNSVSSSFRIESPTILKGNCALGVGSAKGPLSFSNTIDLGGENRTLTIGPGDITFAGNVTNGGLLAEGSGKLILSGANTYIGPTTIGKNITLQLGADAALGTLATSSAITNEGVLVFASSKNHTQGRDFGKALSGSGKVQLKGAGDLTLNCSNSYGGGTLITQGTLRVGQVDDALGKGPLTFDGNALLSTQLNGGARALANEILINDGITASFDGGYAPLTLNGIISGTGNVAKVSIGDVLLTAANTYSGKTRVAKGALWINGNQSAAKGELTVDQGASFGGTGTTGAALVTVKGTITGGAPESTGKLSTKALTLDHGAIYHADVNSGTGGADQLSVDGNLTISPSAKLEVKDLGNASLKGPLVIATYSGKLSGKFADRDQGAVITAGSNRWILDYGSGNNSAITLKAAAK